MGRARARHTRHDIEEQKVQDRTKYYVVIPDELNAVAGGPASFIPTFGAPTSVIDLYRTVGVAETNLPDVKAAFTDEQSVAALSKIAEGGISSVADIEAAEIALEALLLHDIVHVITHAPKIDYGNGLIGYKRLDEGQRTDLGFEIMRLADSRDWIFAPEIVRVEGGTVVQTGLRDSPLRGMKVDAIGRGTRYWNTDIALGISAALGDHGVAAYLTEPDLLRPRRGDGFHKHLCSRINESWQRATAGMPPVTCTIALPPMLAIVMNRLMNREDLLAGIRELREELRPVRGELKALNEIATRSTDQGDVERMTKRITEAFDDIVPESRRSPAEKRLLTIMRVYRLAKATGTLGYKCYKVLNGSEKAVELAKATRDLRDAVLETNLVVDRTVTSQKFAELAELEALQSLAKMLSEAEIRSIEQSLDRKHIENRKAAE
jgi:hypothetical protein